MVKKEEKYHPHCQPPPVVDLQRAEEAQPVNVKLGGDATTTFYPVSIIAACADLLPPITGLYWTPQNDSNHCEEIQLKVYNTTKGPL